MSVIVKHIPHTVDLNEPIKKVYIDTLLATEDNLAHCFDITLVQGVPSGADVTAYFIRYSDNATITLNGTVNGNVASVTLSKSCYNKAGQYAVIIKVVADGVTNTVFYGEGTIFTSMTDTILDPENVVPSLSDLLAQIEAMETATEAAKTATTNANNATTNANNAATAANTAADAANTAAQNWSNGTAANANQLNGKSADKYVLHDDALTLEEIQASTDLTGKVASAEAAAKLSKIGMRKGLEGSAHSVVTDAWTRINSSVDLDAGNWLLVCNFFRDQGGGSDIFKTFVAISQNSEYQDDAHLGALSIDWLSHSMGSYYFSIYEPLTINVFVKHTSNIAHTIDVRCNFIKL